MGFINPPMPWAELERRLSGVSTKAQGDGGDAPAWSHHRDAYVAPPELEKPQGKIPYAELHCHSNFSFLDGASHPEELAEEAARLGLEAVALTDHDGLYGVVRFAEAARALGVRTAFGAELSLGLTKPQNGVADPQGNHLVVIARDPQGYANLSRAISHAQLNGKQKGRPIFTLEELAGFADGHWAVLTGCRKGTVPAAVSDDNIKLARIRLHELGDAFGRANVHVELWDHNQPLDSTRNDVLADLAHQCEVNTVVTNNVHYATTSQRQLANAMAAVRSRRSLDELQSWLPAAGSAHMRSGEEQARRFARFPGAVERATELGSDCAFDLRLVAPRLPDFPVPPGHNEKTFLEQLTIEGALRRYGPREQERVKGAWAQLDHELELINQLDFPGYFLIVWDIVEFCRKSNILCQGRGSAANSAVCYSLGITNVDAVGYQLLFERFLAPDREGAPDIDVDIESGRREEVIQYVYERYGRENTAQVANVITYRPRSAVRDMAKALGYSQGQQDAWAKQIEQMKWAALPTEEGKRDKGGPDNDTPMPVLELANQVLGFPRHMGIHSGGMVICKTPVVEACPVEWGKTKNRSVLQWDKDDCAAVGLVKFDLLGLGMLSALHNAIDVIRDHHKIDLDLAHLPQEDAVYDMLCRADSLGVFQVESRAQIATLPRLKPRVFYDLVVEVALIRPGPIQGNAVHPYIRRHSGQEDVTYLDPLLENALKRTLGVPLFQEQLMHMAIDVANFTAADADELRRAVSSRQSTERINLLRARLYAGMAENGITGKKADTIYQSMEAFANFGFAESHAISFALLVYASAYIKHHWPEAFLVSLLNAQPMGFWSPYSLIADARRHGVTVHGPDVNLSAAGASLMPDGSARVGISSIKFIDDKMADLIASGRPYADSEDLMRRCDLQLRQLEALATAGALDCFGTHRRQALWSAGAVVQSRPDRLPGIIVGSEAPELSEMTEYEKTTADLRTTGVSSKHHPMEFVREQLKARGMLTSDDLQHIEPGTRVEVGGLVTHRQRPGTAQGITFLNLEDETGHINIVCSVGVWMRYRKVARSAGTMAVRGILERAEGVTNVIADRMEVIAMLSDGTVRSRDFH